MRNRQCKFASCNSKATMGDGENSYCFEHRTYLSFPCTVCGQEYQTTNLAMECYWKHMNNTYERFISETAAMYAAWMKLKAGKTILVEISPGGWHIFVVEPKKEEKPVTWKCEYCGEDVPRNMNHVCREFLEQLGLPFVNTEKAEKKD